MIAARDRDFDRDILLRPSLSDCDYRRPHGHGMRQAEHKLAKWRGKVVDRGKWEKAILIRRGTAVSFCDVRRILRDLRFLRNIAASAGL